MRVSWKYPPVRRPRVPNDESNVLQNEKKKRFQIDIEFCSNERCERSNDARTLRDKTLLITRRSPNAGMEEEKNAEMEKS